MLPKWGRKRLGRSLEAAQPSFSTLLAIVIKESWKIWKELLMNPKESRNFLRELLRLGAILEAKIDQKSIKECFQKRV